MLRIFSLIANVLMHWKNQDGQENKRQQFVTQRQKSKRRQSVTGTDDRGKTNNQRIITATKNRFAVADTSQYTPNIRFYEKVDGSYISYDVENILGVNKSSCHMKEQTMYSFSGTILSKYEFTNSLPVLACFCVSVANSKSYFKSFLDTPLTC